MTPCEVCRTPLFLPCCSRLTNDVGSVVVAHSLWPSTFLITSQHFVQLTTVAFNMAVFVSGRLSIRCTSIDRLVPLNLHLHRSCSVLHACRFASSILTFTFSPPSLIILRLRISLVARVTKHYNGVFTFSHFRTGHSKSIASEIHHIHHPGLAADSIRFSVR